VTFGSDSDNFLQTFPLQIYCFSFTNYHENSLYREVFFILGGKKSIVINFHPLDGSKSSGEWFLFIPI